MAANNEWLTFLAGQNAQIENNRVLHFGDPVAERRQANTDNVLCDLTHLGFISAIGEEAESFLQNQLSNDIKKVSETRSQLSAYCTAKGRALSLFRSFKRDSDFYLQLPLERLDATLKRLRMFVLRTKVTLDDASDKLVAFGIAAPDAQAHLANFLPSIPQDDNECAINKDLLVCKIPGTPSRYMLIAETAIAINAWKQLASNLKLCSNTDWRYLDIQAGQPQIYEANAEAFVPQMLNLHSLDGISFQKGCYPGQEVVARMYYLGKLKRRMYLAHVDAKEQPMIGNSIFTEGDTSQDGVGKVVDSQANPNGGFELLAVLQVASTEQGSLHLGDASGPQLELREVPYKVALEREDKPSVKL